MLNGADYSITIEQQIPLSGIRGHRRASALADVDRLRAETNRTSLDVGVEAANAYLMLQERRRTAALVSEQIAFARDVVSAANARYASGTAPQSDVLRAEVEVARLDAMTRALIGEVRGAEAMLNTRLALDADRPVPDLAPLVFTQSIPSWSAIKTALAARPELAAGRAEVARAENLQPKPAQVRALIDAEAQSYENPAEVVKWFYMQPQQLSEIESLALEANVVDWVVAKAKVTEKAVSFDELMGSG